MGKTFRKKLFITGILKNEKLETHTKSYIQAKYPL